MTFYRVHHQSKRHKRCQDALLNITQIIQKCLKLWPQNHFDSFFGCLKFMSAYRISFERFPLKKKSASTSDHPSRVFVGSESHRDFFLGCLFRFHVATLSLCCRDLQDLPSFKKLNKTVYVNFISIADEEWINERYPNGQIERTWQRRSARRCLMCSGWSMDDDAKRLIRDAKLVKWDGMEEVEVTTDERSWKA